MGWVGAWDGVGCRSSSSSSSSSSLQCACIIWVPAQLSSPSASRQCSLRVGWDWMLEDGSSG